MTKKIILCLILFSSLCLYSQNNSNEISSEGSAKTRVKPDLANFTIRVEKKNTVEKNAIKELNEEIEKLQKVFLKIGFTEKNIKISEYKISSEENDNKKEYFSSNTLTIDFSLENKVIEAFYQEIQNENLKDLDINFETHISEDLEKVTRKKLIQIAIQDAKSNAENIAMALDVKINSVKQVSKYAFRDIVAASFKSDKKYDMPKASYVGFVNPKTSFDKYQVEEIELEETISVVYEIIKK